MKYIGNRAPAIQESQRAHSVLAFDSGRWILMVPIS